MDVTDLTRQNIFQNLSSACNTKIALSGLRFVLEIKIIFKYRDCDL